MPDQRQREVKCFLLNKIEAYYANDDIELHEDTFYDLLKKENSEVLDFLNQTRMEYSQEDIKRIEATVPFITSRKE